MRPRVAAVFICLGMMLAFVEGAAAQDRQTGPTKEEIAACEKAVKKDPKDSEAWRQLSVCYFTARRYDDAIAACKKAIELDPGDANSWGNLGVCFRGAGHLGEAIDALRKSVELNPGEYRRWRDLGTCHTEADRYDEAIVAFKEAIRLKPDYLRAWEGLGHCYVMTDRAEEAVDTYKQIVQLDPGSAWSWFFLGTSYDKAGKMLESAMALQKAAALDSGTETIAEENARYMALKFLAGEYMAAGRYDDAIATAKELTKTAAKQAAWRDLGECCQKAGRTDEAMTAYGEALKLFPMDPFAATALGDCLRDKGRIEEAIASYKQALKYFDFGPAWSGLAGCYEKLGRKKDAAAALEKAKKLGSIPVMKR